MRTIQSELTEKGYAKVVKKTPKPVRKKINEKLSDRDLKELMGCNKKVFVRGKGGAYKQRWRDRRVRLIERAIERIPTDLKRNTIIVGTNRKENKDSYSALKIKRHYIS